MFVARFNCVQSLHCDFVHLVGDRVFAVACKAIDASSHPEVRAEFTGLAVKLVDVAFPVTDVDAALRCREQRGRMLQVLQPAHAFLLLDRHPRRVNLGLERARALKLLAAPELDRSDAERQAVGRHGKT